MNPAAFKALVLNELRLRSRRIGSLVCVLAVIVISWLVVADPAGGRAMMTMGKQRVAYESLTLAFGTATIAGMLMGLAGFYLVRGRTQEDLRSGTGGLLASAPVGNVLFLLARWCGAVLYLLSLMGALMLSVWVLHLVRGEGPLQPWVYLQTYLLVLTPTLMLAASVATLCDAWAPLMGKRGDLLFFMLWVAQFMFMPVTLSAAQPSLSGWQVFDISGLTSHIVRMSELLHVQHFSIGGSPFDSSLPVLPAPDGFWSLQLLALRLGSALLALLPLGLAVALFHRYSPDKVKARENGKLFALLAWVQHLLQPLSRAVNRLLPLCARWPGLAGQVAAETVVSLSVSPLALLLGAGVIVAGVASPAHRLGPVLCAAAVLWGILISDIAARDHQARALALTNVTLGGPRARYLRQWLASLVLGVIFSLPVLLRWSVEQPLLAAALLSGLIFLSAVASFLGQSTGSGRAYLSLFLFGFYLSVQTPKMAWLDPMGFNGSANATTVGSYLLIALALLAAGLGLNQRRHA